jgi:hypothetical protein
MARKGPSLHKFKEYESYGMTGTTRRSVDERPQGRPRLREG